MKPRPEENDGSNEQRSTLAIPRAITESMLPIYFPSLNLFLYIQEPSLISTNRTFAFVPQGGDIASNSQCHRTIFSTLGCPPIEYESFIKMLMGASFIDQKTKSLMDLFIKFTKVEETIRQSVIKNPLFFNNSIQIIVKLFHKKIEYSLYHLIQNYNLPINMCIQYIHSKKSIQYYNQSMYYLLSDNNGVTLDSFLSFFSPSDMMDIDNNLFEFICDHKEGNSCSFNKRVHILSAKGTAYYATLYVYCFKGQFALQTVHLHAFTDFVKCSDNEGMPDDDHVELGTNFEDEINILFMDVDTLLANLNQLLAVNIFEQISILENKMIAESDY